MAKNLQESLGINEGPLWEAIVAVDEYLGNKDWYVVHKMLPPDILRNGLYFYLGHPVKYPKVEESEVDDYQKWLETEGETEFAGIVKCLQDKGFEAKRIQETMMYIMVNLEYLKDRVDKKYRSIDSGWPAYER